MTADTPTAKRTRRSISTNVNNYETGRAIISCDYCHLHWHLDCVDPPMIIMPPWSKKWMCPNHAEHLSVSLPILSLAPTTLNPYSSNLNDVSLERTPPPLTLPNLVRETMAMLRLFKPTASRHQPWSRRRSMSMRSSSTAAGIAYRRESLRLTFGIK